MSARWRVSRLAAAALTALALVTACTAGSSSGPDQPGGRTIRVASFDFAENEIVAEIYAAALTGHGFAVSRLMSLGSREVVQPALQQGLVDLVPEYAGSALAFLQQSSAAPRAPTTGSVRPVLDDALARRGLVALRFAPAEDQNGIVVSRSTAVSERLHAISDLAPVVGRLTFGGPPECPERPLCLAGLRTRYGLRFRRFVPMSSRQVTVEALAAAEISVGLVETTDPHLGDGPLVLLADDRGLQPAENVVPVLRREVVRRYGTRLASVLDRVSTRLTTAGLIGLNRQVVLQRRPAREVAATWLADNGLAGPGS